MVAIGLSGVARNFKVVSYYLISIEYRCSALTYPSIAIFACEGSLLGSFLPCMIHYTVTSIYDVVMVIVK